MNGEIGPIHRNEIKILRNCESRRLEGHRAALSKDDNKVIVEVCRPIDRLRDRPATYLAAAPEARAEILRDMTDGITLTAAAAIRWRQPFSFLMQPAILDLKSAAAVASPPAAARSQVTAAADSQVQAPSKEAARILYDKTPPPFGEKKANGVSGDDGAMKSSPLSTSMGQGQNPVNWNALEDIFLEFRLWLQTQ